MKHYWTRLMIILIFLAALAALFDVLCIKSIQDNNSARNVIVQRITSEVEDKSYQISSNVIYYDKILDEVFDKNRSKWESIYGKQACPTKAGMILLFNDMNGHAQLSDDSDENKDVDKRISTKSGSIVSGVYYHDTMIGIIEYTFPTQKHTKVLVFLNIGFALAILVVLLYAVWVYKKILVPFNKLSDYPERLSKGELAEKIPESRDKYFGKYIWGMNMLSDKLENDRETINRLTGERQKFVTTIVHGIKTPTANIKLLAEAISTGLYDPEGKVNEKDAELSDKIKHHANDIESMVAKAMEEGTTAVFEYNPSVDSFYRNKLEEYIKEEYTYTLKRNRIPLNMESDNNLLINSDYDGVCRILRQLMDNAIKYGDGTGINIKMTKNDEGNFISVENYGKPLPESEVTYVFNSLWRGSNSEGVPGHGVGLYESRIIARKLGGDIRMRIGENATEVILFIP